MKKTTIMLLTSLFFTLPLTAYAKPVLEVGIAEAKCADLLTRLEKDPKETAKIISLYSTGMLTGLNLMQLAANKNQIKDLNEANTNLSKAMLKIMNTCLKQPNMPIRSAILDYYTQQPTANITQ